MVPFYGQGVNCGFEDVRVLDDFMGQYPNDTKKAFSEYTAKRHKDLKTICDLAMHHYHILAQKSEPRRTAIERYFINTLYYFFPKTFMPLYSMVSFSNIPYSKVIQRHKRQRKYLYSMGAAFLIAGVLTFRYLKGNVISWCSKKCIKPTYDYLSTVKK
jgi:kynurenine 3-monooxygenase